MLSLIVYSTILVTVFTSNIQQLCSPLHQVTLWFLMNCQAVLEKPYELKKKLLCPPHPPNINSEKGENDHYKHSLSEEWR